MAMGQGITKADFMRHAERHLGGTGMLKLLEVANFRTDAHGNLSPDVVQGLLQTFVELEEISRAWPALNAGYQAMITVLTLLTL